MKIFFDIDGVLNNTPARGSMGFGVDHMMCNRLKDIRECLHGELVCISFWRGTPQRQEVKLPFQFTWAPHGEKRKSWHGADLIIDDQLSLYPQEAPVYAVNGHVGLQGSDVAFIVSKYKPIRDAKYAPPDAPSGFRGLSVQEISKTLKEARG